MQNYIIGYGSLIEKNSRMRTTPGAKDAYPVKVNGFVRGWWARGSAKRFSTTYLGCLPIEKVPKNSHGTNFLNGVVYSVTEEELEVTDRREAAYQRVKVRNDLIEDFCKILALDDRCWIYVNDITAIEGHLPDKKYPIVQSYVDICINGCIEIEQKYKQVELTAFTAEFIQSTMYWSAHWVNDRVYPRRPFIYQPNARKIDQLLERYLKDPTLLDKIYCE